MASKLSFLSVILALGLPSTHLAQAATINRVTYDESGKKADPSSGGSTLSPEQSLRLKKVLVFPTVDDVSGVLAPKLDEKLQELFSRNIRFDLVRDPQVQKALNADEPGYAKAAASPQVHQEAARATGADTTVLLRTKNVGNQTEMTLEFRDAGGEILFSDTGSIPTFSNLQTRWGLVEKLFRGVLAKLPFEGSVSGRTASTVTIDLGMGDVREGEELELARIVSVQRHPLLKTVIGTDYVRVGRARVTNVDKVMSFAEVQEEYPSERVVAGSKVLRAKPPVRRGEVPVAEPTPGGREPRRYSERPAPVSKEETEEDPFNDRLKGDFDRPTQRYGQAGLNLQYGSLSHAQTYSGSSTEFSGSGIGGDISGELWITKNWIANLGYGFHSATLSGPTGSLGSTSWSRIEGFGGYRFFPGGDMAEGMSVTGALGYQAMSFSLPTSATANVAAKKYTGIAMRIDGDIPIALQQKVTVGFSIQPFTSVVDTGGSLGTPNGGTVIGLHADWNYRIADSLWARVGFQFDSANASYANSNTATDKRFAIGPGIYYSF